MNPVLQKILSSGTVESEDGTTYPIHSQIPTADGEFIYRLVKQHAPKTSIEVGLAYGVSAMFICDALREGQGQRHVVIDPVQHGDKSGDALSYDESARQWQNLEWSTETGWRGIGLANLRRAGYADLIELHEQPSHIALPALLANNEKFDLAFIDGWHTFDYVLLDFFYLDLMLRPGGIMIFDDSNYTAIRKVLRYILTNRRYSVVEDQRITADQPKSLKRRGMESLARSSATWHGAFAPEKLEPDASLGLPQGRCIALRKEADDVLGDGSGESRSWNFHRPF